MMRPSRRCPKSVTVVAILWIALGALTVHSGAWLFAWPVLQRPVQDWLEDISRQAARQHAGLSPEPVFYRLPCGRLIGATETCVGVLAVVFAIYLLKLQAWARRALAILSLGWVLLVVGWRGAVIAGLLGPGQAPGIEPFEATGVTFWVLVLGAPVITLVFLCRKSVRAALSPGRAPSRAGMVGEYSPEPSEPVEKPNAPSAIAALVCGLVGLPLGVIVFGLGIGLGIVAIVLGAIALRQMSRTPGGYAGVGMATAGIILGILDVMIGVLYLILFFLLLLPLFLWG